MADKRRGQGCPRQTSSLRLFTKTFLVTEHHCAVGVEREEPAMDFMMFFLSAKISVTNLASVQQRCQAKKRFIAD
jgi:hypothetical protein